MQVKTISAWAPALALVAALGLLGGADRAQAQCGSWSGQDTYDLYLAPLLTTPQAPTGGHRWLVVELTIYNPSSTHSAQYTLSANEMWWAWHPCNQARLVSGPKTKHDCVGTLLPGEHHTVVLASTSGFAPLLNLATDQGLRVTLDYENEDLPALVEAEVMGTQALPPPDPGSWDDFSSLYKLTVDRRGCL